LALRSPLTRHPLGVRVGRHLDITFLGVTLAIGCVASRESASIKVLDLHGSPLVGVEVKTGETRAYTNLEGIATFYDLTPGRHDFNASFNWFQSCGPASVTVSDATIASATVTLRLTPGQGLVNQNGKAVTPTAQDLADEAVEDSLPCPEPSTSQE
jgi:hypothetical protein